MIYDKLDTFFIYAPNKDAVRQSMPRAIKIHDTGATKGTLHIYQVTVSLRLNEDYIRKIYGTP